MTKENIRKVILAILFVLILVVIALFIGRFTYSYLGPAPTDELKGTGEVTPSGDTIIFSKGNDLSLSASTDNFHTGSGNLTDTTNPQVRLIASSDTNDASTTYFAGIRIYENTYSYSTDNNTAELILSVYDENGNLLEASSDTLSFVEVNGVRGFDITGLTGAYNIAIDHPISTTSSTNGTTHTWTFTLTFVNLDNDQSINETAALDMEVVLQKDRIEMPTFRDECIENNSSSLACHVATQYTGVDGENGIYYHTSSLANSAQDNSYRYAGANPNNYVCFGSDAATCPSDNLYRIIGVFGSEAKLIKWDYANSDLLGTSGAYSSSTYSASSYGNYDGAHSTVNIYHWTSSSNRSNVWSGSALNTTNLNGTYLNNIGSTWGNLIANHSWKVGGGSPEYLMNSTAQTTYNYEVGSSSSSTTYLAKIGLMYISDYGFAASNDYWTTAMSNYSNAINSNWMYMGMREWTISRRSDISDMAFDVYDTGDVGSYLVDLNSYAVRPSFYLESSVNYVSGSGSSADPIRIS